LSAASNAICRCVRRFFVGGGGRAPGAAAWIEELHEIDTNARKLAQILAEIKKEGPPRILAKWERELTSNPPPKK
jgi:hypothetical protein